MRYSASRFATNVGDLACCPQCAGLISAEGAQRCRVVVAQASCLTESPSVGQYSAHGRHMIHMQSEPHALSRRHSLLVCHSQLHIPHRHQALCLCQVQQLLLLLLHGITAPAGHMTGSCINIKNSAQHGCKGSSNSWTQKYSRLSGKDPNLQLINSQIEREPKFPATCASGALSCPHRASAALLAWHHTAYVRQDRIP